MQANKTTPWLPLILIVGILAVLGLNPESPPSAGNKTLSDKHRAVASDGREQRPLQFADSDPQPSHLDDSASEARQAAPIAAEPVGEFRGDWGETPIYAKDDRVIYNNVEYQSLENDNQNQPPADSPQYWQALKTLETADAAACQARLPGSDMHHCDFSQGSGLKDKNLRGANLSNARLTGELGNADLSGANLSSAALIGSLVIGPAARADHANLSKLQSDANNPLIGQGADFNHSDFSAASLAGAKLAGANLSAGNFSNADLSGAQLANGLLSNANLQHSNLSYADLSAAELGQADLSAADLSDANLSDGDFAGANLSQARLAGSDLARSDLRGANLSGAMLQAAKNTDSALIDSGTDFSNAVCPDGARVDGMRISSCLGHGF